MSQMTFLIAPLRHGIRELGGREVFVKQSVTPFHNPIIQL